MSSEIQTPQEKAQVNVVMIALICGSLAATLNGSILNVAVPMFMDVFDSSITTTQWLVTGYILATGLVSPTVGYIGDRFGYKKAYLCALLLIMFTSTLCIFAWRIELLIFFRFLQGMAGGIILPISLALIYQLVAKSKQAISVSMWNMSTICGGVLGPVLAGFLLKYVSWRYLFVVGLPLVVIAFIVSAKCIPHQQPMAVDKKLDTVAIGTVSICSMLLLLAFSNGPTWGWENPMTIGFLVIGVAGIIYFFFRCMKVSNPLLNLQVFKHKYFVYNLVFDFMINNITYAFVFVAPLFFQNAMGMSAFETSLVTLPSAVMMIVLMPLIGKMYNKVGPRKLIVLGGIIVTVATLPLLTLNVSMPIWLIIACFVGRSIGMCHVTTPAVNLGMGSIPRELTGHASAVSNWFKQMSGSLIISGSSVLMTMRLQVYQNELPVSTGSEAMAQQIYALASRDVFIYMFVIMIWIIPLGMKIAKDAR